MSSNFLLFFLVSFILASISLVISGSPSPDPPPPSFLPLPPALDFVFPIADINFAISELNADITDCNNSNDFAQDSRLAAGVAIFLCRLPLLIQVRQ